MNPLRIERDLLLLGHNPKETYIACPNEGVAWLTPTQLLELRDWINERVRELQFHGHLPDSHLGD